MDGYSRAIELNPLQAVYWSNRAAAHMHLENYGAALTDATKAIEINPKYIKARAQARPSVPWRLSSTEFACKACLRDIQGGHWLARAMTEHVPWRHK